MICHDIVLKHSSVSGKFELAVDGNPLGVSKRNSSKGFFHRFYIPAKDKRIEVVVRVDESTTGSCYDILIDGVLFNDAEAISLIKFLDLKKSLQKQAEKPILVKRLSYQDFTGSTTGKNNDQTKANSKPVKESKQEIKSEATANQKEGNLLDMDFESFHNKGKPKETKEKSVVDDFLSFT